MKKKLLLIILIIFITFITLLLSRFQVRNIVKSNVPNDVVSDLNDKNVNIFNALGLLEKITKEKHPTPSNYARNIILSYLDEIGVPYTLDTHEFDKESFKEYYDLKSRTMFLEDMTNNGLNPKGYNNINDLFKDGSFGYNTYEEYILNSVNNFAHSNYKSYDELLDYNIKSFDDIAVDGKIKIVNIIASLNSNSDKKDGIVISTHYDSAPNSYGASDNGLNVVSILENIRVLKDKEFKNNIYFVFPDSEEYELLGTELLLYDTNDILKNIKLVVNYDNSGAGGHLALYQSNSGYLTSKYISNIKRVNASTTNNELYNIANLNTSDYRNYSRKYNTINIALYADSNNYHSEKDTYENIDVSSLKETLDNMNQVLEYFGNDEDNYSLNKEIMSFEVFNGKTVQCSKITYYIIVSILYLSSFIITILFIIKKKIKNVIFNLLYLVLSVITFFYLKSIVILLLLPVVITSINEIIIKNEKIKNSLNIIIYSLILFEFGILTFKIVEIIKIGYLILFIPILYLINLKMSKKSRCKV